MKMTPKLYPLKFQPQLKEKVWGGNKLSSDFGKKVLAILVKVGRFRELKEVFLW